MKGLVDRGDPGAARRVVHEMRANGLVLAAHIEGVIPAEDADGEPEAQGSSEAGSEGVKDE